VEVKSGRLQNQFQTLLALGASWCCHNGMKHSYVYNFKVKSSKNYLMTLF